MKKWNLKGLYDIIPLLCYDQLREGLRRPRMLSNDAKEMINYINALLNNKKLNQETPKIAEGDADFLQLEQSLHTIRSVAEALRVGNVQLNIRGKGFVLDSFQHFQKAVKKSNEEMIRGITATSIKIINKKSLSQIKPIKKRERMNNDSEERHRLMTDNACDIIATVDLAGNFTYISPSVEKITGYTPGEIMSHYREIGYFLPGVQKEMDKKRASIREMVERGEHFSSINFEQRQVRKDGESIYTDTVLSGIYDEENNFRELLAVSRDITEKVKERREIKKLSETDKLTQLYNRVKLDSTLENEFNLAKINATIFAIIMIDIDGFKQINDCFGHLAGDMVLVELAKLFKTSIRATDTVGRWGGEEFLMILPDTNGSAAVELAEKIRKQVSQKYFPEQEHMTISMGVSVFNDDVSVDSIIYRADQALYQAKKNGKNQVCTQ